VTTNATTPVVDALCDHLAERIAEFQHGARPPVTPRWREQMRLLVERGPLHRHAPEPMAPAKVRNTIDWVFDHMAEPEGRGSFCWAAQVRSAHALRDHWDQMAVAARAQNSARRGRSAAAIDAALRPPDPIAAALAPQTGQLALGVGS
jgi:hypothetical protein